MAEKEQELLKTKEKQCQDYKQKENVIAQTLDAEAVKMLTLQNTLKQEKSTFQKRVQERYISLLEIEDKGGQLTALMERKRELIEEKRALQAELKPMEDRIKEIEGNANGIKNKK